MAPGLELNPPTTPTAEEIGKHARLRACERAVVEAADKFSEGWDDNSLPDDTFLALAYNLQAAVAAWREAKRGA